MKKTVKYVILGFLILIISNSCFSINDSLIINNIDILRTNIANLQQQNLQQKNILDSLTNVMIEYKISKSFFSNDITTAVGLLVGIFAVIMTIVVFILGITVPKILKQRFNEEIKIMRVEFDKTRNDIDKARMETKEMDIKATYDISRALWYSCLIGKNYLGAFLWGLRHINITYEYNLINNKMDGKKTAINIFNVSEKYVSEIPKHSNSLDIKESAEEVGLLYKKILPYLKDKELEDSLTKLRDDYNRIAWASEK